MALPYGLVSVTGSGEEDGLRLYHIEVHPTNTEQDKPYVLKKRYNQFRYLYGEIKALRKVWRVAFPSKQTLLGDGIEGRRRGLDEWLAEVVSIARGDNGVLLRPYLFEFFCEKSVAPSLSATPFAANPDLPIDAVRFVTFDTRDGTVWYGLDVYVAQHEHFRVWKTYTNFKHLAASTRHDPASFPRKTLSKVVTEKEINARKAELDHWLTNLIDAARGASHTAKNLQKQVRGFLVPMKDNEDLLDDDASLPLSPRSIGSPRHADPSSSGGMTAAVKSAFDEPPEFRIDAVKLTNIEERGGVAYYKVLVLRGAAAGESYSLWKRYSQFDHLHEEVARLFPDTKADFPPKTMGKGGVMGRKKRLDFWMANVVQIARNASISGEAQAAPSAQHVALAQILLEFLDESQKVTQSFDASTGADLVSVSMPSYEDRQGTIFYQIVVELSNGDTFAVAKSYSMFREMCQTCASTVMGAQAFQGFPGKNLNPMNRLLKNTDALVKERHHALANWFTAMVKRAYTEDYKLLRPVVREFLDSTHV